MSVSHGTWKAATTRSAGEAKVPPTLIHMSVNWARWKTMKRSSATPPQRIHLLETDAAAAFFTAYFVSRAPALRLHSVKAE